MVVCCISFDSYIKPQLLLFLSLHFTVVYLLIPTSNHNCYLKLEKEYQLYIFWFLHQTTTMMLSICYIIRCISFDSYIKPQRVLFAVALSAVVYLLIPTSNHNPSWRMLLPPSVVYLLIPTSNHNLILSCSSLFALYIFWFLHQTTTWRGISGKVTMLYIFWFLHQTTTKKSKRMLLKRCISFDSYIKPQLRNIIIIIIIVVYLLIPTSNHNLTVSIVTNPVLYIFWFLHQTTTILGSVWLLWSCISFDSYIKPQPIDLKVLISSVYQSLFLIRNGE